MGGMWTPVFAAWGASVAYVPSLQGRRTNKELLTNSASRINNTGTTQKNVQSATAV
jgi:hypothetical protein